MRITDLLQKEAIVLNAKVSSKRETIDLLVALHEKAGNIKDTEKYRQGILDREAGGTTAIGDGIAIPHAKSEAVGPCRNYRAGRRGLRIDGRQAVEPGVYDCGAARRRFTS